MLHYLKGRPHDSYEATRLIRSESVSSLSLYLQEMDADRMHDDVKTKNSLKCAKNMQKTLHMVLMLLIFHRSGIIVTAERMCGYKSAIKKKL